MEGGEKYTNWYILETVYGVNRESKILCVLIQTLWTCPQKEREVSIGGADSISATMCPLINCVLIRGGVVTG